MMLAADTEAALLEAYDAYEKALFDNDAEEMIRWFASDSSTTRFGINDAQRGHAEIASFLRAEEPRPRRFFTLSFDVRLLAPGVAVLSAVFERVVDGRCGFQTQIWKLDDTQWGIVHAHVSLRP